jgi:hypothetical protein
MHHTSFVKQYYEIVFYCKNHFVQVLLSCLENLLVVCEFIYWSTYVLENLWILEIFEWNVIVFLNS